MSVSGPGAPGTESSTPATQRRIAELFDEESARYDDAYDAEGGHVLRIRLEAVLDLLGTGPGKVLDAGMGPGRLCAEMQARGFTASGVDLSERMVELARERLPEARERLLQGTMSAVPFPDASFDAVAATGVLEYVDDLPAAIAEIGRVLDPGGRVVVSIPNPFSIHVGWGRYVWHPTVRAVKRALPRLPRPAPHRKPPIIRVGDLTAMLERAGLGVTEVRHVSFAVVLAPLDGVLPRIAERVAAWLEQARPPGSRLLATQVVLAAEKLPRT